ncbi:Dynein heavy chain 14, axonemal, partial [Sciurus carolinensis]|nr:Dynein heavy chain 14, axonemal [Sciurus carolinensis]
SVPEPKEDDVIRHITRLREKLGWETTLLPKDLKYPSSKIAVQEIILKEPLKDDGEFVYCIPRYNPEGLYNPYDPQVVSTHRAKNCKEFWIITASFVSKVVKLSGNTEDVELTPVLEWLSERHFYYLLQRFNIFSKFRSFLYRNLFWADEIFQDCLLYVKGLCEDAINLKNNNEHKDNPSAIWLIKLDTSRTYSIDEFCEEQLQQTTQALKQLEDVRDKVISEVKSTILKVAEKKEIREYFESKSFEHGTTHFKLPSYRHLLETSFRFLMLIDYILQELIRQLMNIAVTLLLELFNDSATMPLSNGKKNEDLIGTFKNNFSLVGKTSDCEELVNSSNSKSEVKTNTDIHDVLNSITVEKDLRKIYAPIFEVNIHLRTPSESYSPENSEEDLYESDQGPEKCMTREEDEMSENEDSVKNDSSEALLPKAKGLQTFSYNLDDFISGRPSMFRSGRFESNQLTTRLLLWQPPVALMQSLLDQVTRRAPPLSPGSPLVFRSCHSESKQLATQLLLRQPPGTPVVAPSPSAVLSRLLYDDPSCPCLPLQWGRGVSTSNSTSQSSLGSGATAPSVTPPQRERLTQRL